MCDGVIISCRGCFCLRGDVIACWRDHFLNYNNQHSCYEISRLFIFHLTENAEEDNRVTEEENVFTLATPPQETTQIYVQDPCEGMMMQHCFLYTVQCMLNNKNIKKYNIN